MNITENQSLKRLKSTFVTASFLISTFMLLASVGLCHSKKPLLKPKTWVGTWATAPQLVEPNNMPPAPGLSNNTFRQVVCVSLGGKIIQLRFSNQYSKSPVTMRSVQIAVSKGGSSIDESTTKILTFSGKTETTMEAGGENISDAIPFNLKPRMQVAITIYFGETSLTITGHPGSRTTSYLLSGDGTSPNADFKNAANMAHWYIIDGIDVETTKNAAAVAVIGDSITDGRGSGTDKQDRWPDVLATRLLKNEVTNQTGVLNLGIGGNCVLRGGLGPTALNRLNCAALKQQGVRWLIIMEGVNDIGGSRDSTAALAVALGLIAAFDKMITAAHAQGIKVYGTTITPIKKSFYYTDYHETARNIVNTWIRSSGHFDSVIDFDKTIRNPDDILSILPGDQSGDYLHPNEDGYQLMGDSIDLSLFK